MHKSWFTHSMSRILGCVVLFLLLVALIRPTLESGLTDDWSTVDTAIVLAKTGHIRYDGWEAAPLGWMLYPAALMIRVFGPTFLSARISTLLESVATICLMYATFIEAGISEGQASFGVITIFVTPIYLLSSVVFMSDIPGTLALCSCYYFCLRALKSWNRMEHRRAYKFLVFACILNTVLGTARQTAWLGVLIMVPCALYIIGGPWRRLTLPLGCIMTCVASITCFVAWFNQQPFTLPAPIFPAHPWTRVPLKSFLLLLRVIVDSCLLLLPITISFLAVRRLERERVIKVAGLLLLVMLFVFIVARKSKTALSWIEVPLLRFEVMKPQTIENTFSMTQLPIKGPPEHQYPFWIFYALLSMSVMSLIGILSSTTRRRGEEQSLPEVLPLRSLAILTGPLLVLYTAILLSRGTYNFVYDRYLIMILPVLVSLILRLRQAATHKPLPIISGIFVACMGAYSVLSLHDLFSVYRTALQMSQVLEAAGVSRRSIDAGWEFNHYTEVELSRFVRQTGIRLPNGSTIPYEPSLKSGQCYLEVSAWTPHVRPLYGFANANSPCPRLADFKPVHYHTWLPPFQRTAYFIREAPGTSVDATTESP